MGKLLAGPNWFLEVRIRKHFPCHFHVIGKDFEAQVDVETLEIIVGDMPRAVEKDVRAWAEKNRQTMVAEWNRCNPAHQYTLRAQEDSND
ncbi:DUF4160 domain-containing protein [Azospirillum sp. YIM B02556]|uniref:DUF4160 domain-containing protein n=2 Tax=Azospirillum endophyticum TaxID=2800326 RepID=A0ABS1F6N3_9PROT|nr:DUF4160 domain-containing protein [Azospirillum endophyticum]